MEIDTINRKLWLYGHGKEKNVDPYYYLLYEADMDKEGTTLLSAENAQHSVIFLHPVVFISTNIREWIWNPVSY